MTVIKGFSKLSKEEKINWKGKFRKPMVNQEVFPRSVEDKLSMWIAVGGTPESVVRAARYGLPVIFAIIGGSPAQFKPLFDYYHKAFTHFKHPEENKKTGVHMHAFFWRWKIAFRHDSN